MIEVSVIIPVFNRLAELQRAIQSVLGQTIQNFEILVIDDHSNIDVKQVTDAYKDERIKYFRLPDKGNANICRNLGIKNASGKFIALLDSDDEWLPSHLEKKITFITHKEVDGVFGSIIIDDGEKRRDAISRPFVKNEKMINYLLSDGIAQTSTHFYKTACAKVVLWDESLIRHQDWDYNVRFSKKYRFVPAYDLTCVVHWKRGERRAEHFDSLIKFIEMNRQDIDPVLYSKYHRGFYSYLLNKSDVDRKYLAHYKNESLRYMDVISLRDFLGAFGNNKSRLQRFFLRIEFIIRIFFK